MSTKIPTERPFSSSWPKIPPPRARAFTLVEVLLAIGITVFAILSVVGLMGRVMNTSDSNRERRAMAEAADGLRRTLQTTPFSTAYDWVRNGKTLLYINHRTDSNGNPDPNGPIVIGRWIDPDSESVALNQAEAARTGSWVRARLGLSPTNPGGTNLPTDSSAWDRATVRAVATLDILPTPNPLGNTNSAILHTEISLLR